MVEESIDNLKRLIAAYRDHVADRHGYNFIETHGYMPDAAQSRYLTLDECDYIFGLDESPEVD